MLENAVLGAAIAFCFAAACTPVGVSGAVFLVPVQVSVLGTPSPSLTPTNLLYNLIAIPGALWRYHRAGTLRSRLATTLVLGTLPGVIAGAVIRVELLSGPEAFYFVIAALLIPLGAWLAFGTTPRPSARRSLDQRPLVAMSLIVGVVGGIYGIGGGSILAPVLVGTGFAVAEVAPAALAATFLTSIAGVVTYALLSIGKGGEIAGLDRRHLARYRRSSRQLRRRDASRPNCRGAASANVGSPRSDPGRAIRSARHLTPLANHHPRRVDQPAS